MTDYISINKFTEIDTLKVNSYGKRREIRTTHCSGLVDLTVPGTFGLITLLISRKYNKSLFYLQGFKHYADKIRFFIKFTFMNMKDTLMKQN